MSRRSAAIAAFLVISVFANTATALFLAGLVLLAASSVALGASRA